MLEVIAIEESYFWIILQEKEKYFILSTPYENKNFEEVDKNYVFKTLENSKFTKIDNKFDTINKAIEYFKNEYIKFKESSGYKAKKLQDYLKLLKFANDKVLLNVIKKINMEFIPNGELEKSNLILKYLLSLEKVISDESLLYEFSNAFKNYFDTKKKTSSEKREYKFILDENEKKEAIQEQKSIEENKQVFFPIVS